jgi:hypothetical protein
MKKITATALVEPTNPIKYPYYNTDSSTSNKEKKYPDINTHIQI